MNPLLDCSYYLGEKPCKHKRLCPGCPHYQPAGIRIIILKLGAMGDALRTTPILKALKRQYRLSTITWVTDPESYPVLLNNPYIDRLLTTRYEDTFPLTAQKFDLLISLDKDPIVTALAMKIDATIRMGFAMSPYGTLDIFNDASRYSWKLGLDDDLKFFKNRKTYQETIYEIAELSYERDEYVYCLSDTDIALADQIMGSLSVRGSGPAIGLNTGCGDVFATKKWPDQHFIELSRMLRKKLDARVFLLGGRSEDSTNETIEKALSKEAINTGSHSLGVFAGLLKRMDAVVASDTMALHLALAVGTPIVGLFGPTCAQEIDFYDRGEPILIVDNCSPCYRKSCRREKSCMHDILPEQVLSVLKKYVKHS